MEQSRCIATSKRTGKRCGRPPAIGLDKCSMHAGISKDRRLAVAREAELKQQLARLDLAPVENPLKEIAVVAAQVLWFKDQVAERVNELTSLRYSTEGGKQLRAEVALFERALDRCEKFLGSMARLNIDERLVRIEQAKAEVIVAAVDAALAKAGVSGERATEARREAARHLRSA